MTNKQIILYNFLLSLKDSCEISAEQYIEVLEKVVNEINVKSNSCVQH